MQLLTFELVQAIRRRHWMPSLRDFQQLLLLFLFLLRQLLVFVVLLLYLAAYVPFRCRCCCRIERCVVAYDVSQVETVARPHA